MWRQRRTWEGPNHPWKKERLEEERKLKTFYGLKNKKELWKAETIARKIRKYVRYLNARRAAGFDIEEDVNKFMRKLIRLGLVSENATLNDVLNLTARDVLERRLQTLVWRKGLARTIRQARQLIVHGHIIVGDKVITSPGYLVKKEEEENIRYNPVSPLSDPEHPLRKIIEGKIDVSNEEGNNIKQVQTQAQ